MAVHCECGKCGASLQCPGTFAYSPEVWFASEVRGTGGKAYVHLTPPGHTASNEVPRFTLYRDGSFSLYSGGVTSATNIAELQRWHAALAVALETLFPPT